MALKFIEGWEWLGGSSSFDSTTLGYKWEGTGSGYSLIANAPGRVAGYAMKVGSASGSSDTLYTKTFSNHNTWIVGFGFKRSEDLDGMYSWSGTLFHVLNSFSIACQITHDQGFMRLRNASFTSLHTWTLPEDRGVWKYYEFKFVVNGASSSCEFCIDGVSQGSSGTKTFSQSTANKFTFFGFQNNGDGVAYLLDDMYFCDGSGSTNNNFLGPCIVECIMPNGAGTYSQSTPSAGQRWQCVDEKPPAYGDQVSFSSSGMKDTYACQDLSTITGSVFGVQANVFGSADSGEVTKIQHRSGGVDYTAATALNLNSSVDFSVVETSNGSAAWTPTTVNAAEFGLSVEP